MAGKTKERVKEKARKVKERVKEKAKAAKGKVKGKLKSLIALCALCALFVGCSTATPASRATTVQYTFNYDFGKGARNVTINNKTGDGAISSADSSGSTETQTATPTVDVKPDIDVRYNDAIAGATTASKGVLETLASAGKDAVLEMMASKKSGTVEVQKTDGSTATVSCENGQCSFVEK